MGTWGPKSFDNDAALDFWRELARKLVMEGGKMVKSLGRCVAARAAFEEELASQPSEPNNEYDDDDDIPF